MIPTLNLDELLQLIEALPPTILNVAAKENVVALANALLFEKRSEDNYQARYMIFLSLLPVLR